MSQIQVLGLTFAYEGSYDNIFDQVSFCLDTDWKLGFIGRNGKGKTTFLRLLMGDGSYQGSIQTSAAFDYFPYESSLAMAEEETIQLVERWRPDYELWKVCRELELLKTDPEILYRPYRSLSHGEQVKVMLAVLFSEEGRFLLIDEPTNHLDLHGRELLCEYLRKKSGFILVSHDRQVLDSCIDHVLVLERNQILVEKGNFTTWWENKQKRDSHEWSENEKYKKEIRRLQATARQSGGWADKVESRKIGYEKAREDNYFIGSRAYLGEKSRKMQQRRKNLERRQQKAIEEKSKLLKNLEETVDLKIMPLEHHKEVYIKAEALCLSYGSKTVTKNFQMELRRGERIILQGGNGCGKSTVLKAILSLPDVRILNQDADKVFFQGEMSGELQAASGLLVSYVSQDTSHLRGSLDGYIERIGADESLMKALLRQLDFDRIQFEKNMEEYSEGQKKKVLIAGSISQRAHLYIWDEPLNYIDIFSRMQIEKLIRQYRPTMLLVEHDRFFADECDTRRIFLPGKS